jgi:drug/metabolite transporter (DMT)-like permease
MNKALLGTLILTASAVAYSTAGFFTRLIVVDAWTLLFWRGVFAGPEQLGLLALFGTSQFGMGLLLLAIGTPLVSATRGALIGVLQTPLGTLWVWLAFSETPAVATLIGGAIVLAAVVADIVLHARAPKC